MKQWALLAGMAALMVACSNKITGEVEINGKKAELSGCRNGGVYGFRGVELTTKTGERLRIAMTPTGEAWLAVMPAGASTGTEVGKCGTFSMNDQSSTINDVKNVEGRAELDCVNAGFTVKGSVKFENCH